MNVEDLLNAGIASARAGDIEKASRLLMQVVQTDPNSELGWLWLGICRTVPEQKTHCFRRVLAINPQNREVRHQLELLRQGTTRPPDTEPAIPADGNQNTHSQSSVDPPDKHVSDQQRPEKVHKHSDRIVQRKKQKNTGISFALLATGTVIAVCIGILGIYLMGRMISMRNAAPLPAGMPSETATATALPAPAYTPVFEEGRCEFIVPDQVRVTCGSIIVPEDRSGNINDTIRIAVAIYHSTGAAPKPDPILYLQGGPGDEAISWSLGVYDTVISPLIVDRDFVVIDPRGVGYSEPSLDCEEIKNTYLSDIQGKFPANQRASYYEGALLTCKNELVKIGVNLSAYTSTQMAADARDAVIALGYQQANIYGISYGSRIAQLVMRNHSKVVRSAILDSVVPIEVQILGQNGDAFGQTLNVLFEDCRADPVCSNAYPDLESVYQTVVAQLDSQPIQVEVPTDPRTTVVRSVDGAAFRNIILWMLRTPQTIAVIPQLIYRTRDGDRSMLNLSVALPVYAFDSISMGIYVAVNCRDQVFVMSMDELDDTIRELCRVWDVKPPLPGENEPVISDIPALIFAGRYDPVTPLSFADQLAGHLTNGKVILIPDQGHAPTVTGISDCPVKLISSFLLNPGMPLEMSCVNETRPIGFVTPFETETPVTFDPVIVEQYRINSQIPSGWTTAEFGFYNRDRSFGDITQIGMQRAAVPEADWANWLFTNFQGNKGFDQPATKYDERPANGLIWSLYTTTALGNPVDIAFARSGNETLMVLMLSYKDEHDALYKLLFLPVVDSTILSN